MTAVFDRTEVSTIDAALLELAARVALELPAPAAPLDLSDATDDVSRIVSRHQVTGLVIGGFEAAQVQLARSLLDHLVEQHAAELKRCLVIERLLEEVSDLFSSAGVDAVVVKGVANAHLDYPDPAWRVFQDVDLLAPAHQIDDAVRALESAGFARDLPPRTTSWDRRFAKDLTYVGELGPECDLHRTLVPGAFGFWIDLERLLAQSVAFDVAGRSYRALDRTGRLLHAALALTVGEAEPKFAHILDFALTLRSVESVQEVKELAAGSGALILLAEAATRCQRTLRPLLPDATILNDRLDELRSSNTSRWVERAARRTYRSSGGSNTATLLGALIALPGLLDRVAYTWGLILPDRRYRRARRSSARPPEWRTGARELLTRSRR